KAQKGSKAAKQTKTLLKLTTQTRRALRKATGFKAETLQTKLRLATGDCDRLRRVIDATRLLHAAISQVALDDFVAQQREHAAANEQRARIAVPIDARRAAGI